LQCMTLYSLLTFIWYTVCVTELRTESITKVYQMLIFYSL
jgi:hypothetical protein